MKLGFLGVILAFVAVAAQADDSSNFRFRNPLSLASATQGSTSYNVDGSYYTPDGGYAAANATVIEVQRQRQLAAVREQIYEAIGIADYIPRGEFFMGGLDTSWHLTATMQHAVEFSLDARW